MKKLSINFACFYLTEAFNLPLFKNPRVTV